MPEGQSLPTGKLTLRADLRSCVEVEVAALASPCPIVLIGLRGRKATLNLNVVCEC